MAWGIAVGALIVALLCTAHGVAAQEDTQGSVAGTIEVTLHRDEDDRPTLEWQQVNGAAAYRVSGHVSYIRWCTGPLEFEDFDVTEVVSATATKLELPRPTDSELELKDYFLTVEAIAHHDQVIAFGNTATVSDRFSCPAQASLGDLWWLALMVPATGILLMSAARIATREQS